MKDILNERQKDKNKIIKRRKDEKVNTPSRSKGKAKDMALPNSEELTLHQQKTSDQKNPFEVVEDDPFGHLDSSSQKKSGPNTSKGKKQNLS